MAAVRVSIYASPSCVQRITDGGDRIPASGRFLATRSGNGLRAERRHDWFVTSWKLRPGRLIRSVRSKSQRGKGRGEEEDGEEEDEEEGSAFWEGPEGQKKLREIEELKELMNEAKVMEEQILRSQYVEGNSGKTEAELADERAAKLREELARKAMEQVERRKQAEAMFQLGQRAYGRGVYDKSVDIFEAASENIDQGSMLAGEIQIWLAMAYDANNRHADCIALYKKLEERHPSKNIRKQAAHLRYIAEAPKLKISKEEILSIPLLDIDNNSSTRTWSEMVREKKKPRQSQVKKEDPSDIWLAWKRPRWERSPYFWVAVTVWLTAVGVSLVFQS